MSVEVVLLREVARVGAAGAVVRVKPGYARNYLLPRGLAALATPAQLAAVEATKRQRAKQAQQRREEAEALKRRVEGQPLRLTLTLGADAKPFGSVTAHDLWAALKQAGCEVEKAAIRLEQPLKALGDFTVPVKLSAGVEATLTVSVGKA